MTLKHFPSGFVALAVFGALFVCIVPFGAAQGVAPAADINHLLSEQAAAWNRGDIDAFMEYYWKSDQLTFSSGGKTTRGWKATKDGYKRRYATRQQMGKLAFDQLEVTPLGSEAALVLGRWTLDREQEPVGGNFSLVLRRIDGAWRIVHDHTSRSENE